MEDKKMPKLLGYTNRTLPKLIEELLEKNIPVTLHKYGYKIGGFYANLSEESDVEGNLLLQDSEEKDVFIAIDNKGKKHLVSSFKDILELNSYIWKLSIKQDKFKYKKVDPKWFTYLYESGLLEVVPGK